MESEHRRSLRIMFSIPVSVRGEDDKGTPFEAAGRTITLNRHGARIQISHALEPGQTIHVINQANEEEAEFRVVGPISPPLDKVGEWGVECAHVDKNIWDIYFPPSDEDSDAHLLLSCRNCHALVLQSLSLVEVEVLETAGLLTKPCLRCAESTSWGYPQQVFELEIQAYQAAVTAATTGSPIPTERRKSLRRHAQLPVRVRDYYGEMEIAQTENFCCEGFCFSSAREYLVGQGVVVICPYDATNEKPEVRARIVRADPDGERYIYGVHYDQALH